MYKALWYDQLGCPEGFVLQVPSIAQTHHPENICGRLYKPFLVWSIDDRSHFCKPMFSLVALVKLASGCHRYDIPTWCSPQNVSYFLSLWMNHLGMVVYSYQMSNNLYSSLCISSFEVLSYIVTPASGVKWLSLCMSHWIIDSTCLFKVADSFRNKTIESVYMRRVHHTHEVICFVLTLSFSIHFSWVFLVLHVRNFICLMHKDAVLSPTYESPFLLV